MGGANHQAIVGPLGFSLVSLGYPAVAPCDFWCTWWGVILALSLFCFLGSGITIGAVVLCAHRKGKVKQSPRDVNASPELDAREIAPGSGVTESLGKDMMRSSQDVGRTAIAEQVKASVELRI